MIITVLESAEAVGHALASRMAEAIRRTPSTVLGLAAGRTPVAAYAELRRMHAAGQLDFSRTTTFSLDEFVGLPPSDPHSFRQFMHRTLFDRLNVSAAAIHGLDGSAPDLELECARYESAIVRAGGIDLQLLGIGVNGHVGFNEPGEHLIAHTHRARLLEDTRRENAALFNNDIERVPAEALTMGVGTILRASRIVLAATGVSKADAIARTANGTVTTRIPASLLQLHHHVELLVDRAAASQLGGIGKPLMTDTHGL